MLMDLGFVTHGVHMDQRMLVLPSQILPTLNPPTINPVQLRTIRITTPISPTHYPPGPAFLYLVTDAGVPMEAERLMISL